MSIIDSSAAKLLASGAGISGLLSTAKAIFGGPGNSDDWRVRLSIPKNSVFSSGAILAPLRSSNGLVFPFTPTITLTSQTGYEDVGLIHQNYQFTAYQNSKTNAIQIAGVFTAEDAVQAQYWIAAVHFLRSASKMYTGDTEFAGSPPPILMLNGYGDYVFKNIPVVIKDFSVELPQDVNYISTTISDIGSSLADISGIANTVGSITGMLGIKGVSNLANKVSSVANMGTGLAGKVSSLFGGQGVTHVPVKSNISITLQPVYSRESVRQFSLQKFVKGDYVKGSGGYI